MPKSFLMSSAFAGATEGASRSASPIIQADKAEARLMKEQREEQLRVAQATRATPQDMENTAEVNSQQLQMMQQQNQIMLGEMGKQQLYGAFDRYLADFNPRHLNQALQDSRKNPVLAELFKDSVRVDKVSEADRDLLAQSGYDPDLIFANKELQDYLVKTTRSDGSVTVDEVDLMAKVLGYDRYADDREIDRQIKLAQIARAGTRDGLRTATERRADLMARNEGLQPGTPEYNQRFAEILASFDESGPPSGTGLERDADRQTRLEGLEPGDEGYEVRYNEIFRQLRAEELSSSKSRDLNKVDEARDRIDKLVQDMGEESFYDIDFSSDYRVREKFEPQIQRMERLGGLELNADDRKELRSIKALLSVAEPTAELNAQNTGLIDNTVLNLKKYVSDSTEGVDATSSFNAFRNTLLRAFAGSAMSAQEMSRFREELGTLKQQTGPLLAQFRTALVQVKSRLESIAAVNDSRVMHFRVGADQDKLEQIISRLEERIDFFNDPINASQQGSPGPSLTEQDIQQLDLIFEGGAQ